MPQIIRSLAKRPTSSALIVIMLALAIGANTAIYSVAKAVVFAPLPFPKPEQVVLIFESAVGDRFQPGVNNTITVRPGTFQDWRAQSRSFASMAAAQTTQATIMQGDRASVADGFLAGDGFFETMGVFARFGRYFTPDDYVAGSPVVVLADRFWRERYNADPNIIGRDIVFDGAAHRVLGVMPAGFLPTRHGNDPQFWLPLRWTAATKYSRDLWGHLVYARLKDGITPAQAQSEMDGVTARMRAAYPGVYGLGSKSFVNQAGTRTAACG